MMLGWLGLSGPVFGVHAHADRLALAGIRRSA
jgi:hypothetical protein